MTRLERLRLLRKEATATYYPSAKTDSLTMCSTSAAKNGPSHEKEKIPLLLRGWLQVGRSVPSIRIGGLEFGVTAATFAVLTLLRFTTLHLLSRVFGWPEGDIGTENAASSCVAIGHSVNLVPALVACLLSQRYKPSERFDAAPLWWQEAVHTLLQFTTGYMLYDGIVSILWAKGIEGALEDWMFLAHHLITSIYMTSTRMVGAGHMSAMMCMLLGEATNPFHNFYYVGQEAMKFSCCNGPWTEMALYIDTFLFASLYVFIRALVGPVVLCLHISYDLLAHGRPHIPLALMLVWIFLIWAISIGSIPWVEDCWGLLQVYLPASLTQQKEAEL
jgi:hypothetical protein